jgi:hypothetical protein
MATRQTKTTGPEANTDEAERDESLDGAELAPIGYLRVSNDFLDTLRTEGHVIRPGVSFFRDANPELVQACRTSTIDTLYVVYIDEYPADGEYPIVVDD